MPLTRTALFVGMLATVSCGTSHDTMTIAVSERCIGEALSDDMVALRDAILGDLSRELMIPDGQSAVVLRAAVIPTHMTPILTEPISLVLGEAQAKEVLARSVNQACWKDGSGRAVRWSGDSGDPLSFWSAFRRENPGLSGLIVVSSPVLTHGTIESATVIVDYHCGEQCGAMWVVVATRKNVRWKVDQHHVIAHY